MKTPDQLQTATDFLQFFEAIPDEKWTSKKFVREANMPEQRCCALGHLGMRDSFEYNEATDRLNRILNYRVAAINDGDISTVHTLKYDQPTPKARICAALRDAIAAGK